MIGSIALFVILFALFWLSYHNFTEPKWPDDPRDQSKDWGG